MSKRKVAWQDWMAVDRLAHQQGRDSPALGVWERDGRTRGNVGPAARRLRCPGKCWRPNRYGACMFCGGDRPTGLVEEKCVCAVGHCCAAHGLHCEPHRGCVVKGSGGGE